MKKFLYFLAFAVLAAAGIYLYNYLQLIRPVDEKLAQDNRNAGIDIAVHYQYYVLPSIIVVDLRQIPGAASQVGVFRAFLQLSESLKDNQYQEVLLAAKGQVRFKITGAYFKELGETFSTQNPLYTVRTFPEHVFNPDGSNAYGEVSGGLLGVLSKQMEDFKDFSGKWYINDMTEGR